MLTILDGKPEGTIQFHEFPGAGSVGDEKRGDLMSGFTKAPFHGAAYTKRGIVKGVVLMSRASTQPCVEYVCGLLQDVVSGLAKDMLNANQHEIAKLNALLATMTHGDELTDLSALKERKVNKGLAINRVLLHAAEYFTAYSEQARMFDVRDALFELTGVLPRGAQQGDAINISRFYGREMHVLTVLQRAGDVEAIKLNVLSIIWGRLKGKGGSTFDRLTTNLWNEPPTIVEYDETAKKKTTAFAVKVKGMLAFAPDWEYGGQDGMATVKDYQRIPTVGCTAIQQTKYIETLSRLALEDGIHLRTSSTFDEIHVTPTNCAPEDIAWDITYTFLKAGHLTGYKANITNLEPVHVAKASTDPVDAGFKRAAVADGDLVRSFRTWAHTFITKAMAVASGNLGLVGRGGGRANFVFFSLLKRSKYANALG